ncbi:hypothetical protein RB595_009291 [Gaeumannomyces hyphopodioides]
MSMSVVIISTDFRRATVKVSPGTFLIDVLEEACKKLSISSDKYMLKHNNRQLELSNQIRAYNLTPGAKLELVVKSNSPSIITVALKLPESEAAGIPNGRLVEKFRSDTTLWKMLRHFESGASTSTAGAPAPGPKRQFNFTARAIPQTIGATGSGQLYHEGPVLLVVGREISSLADFQKTLSQLGISGNVLMNLSFRQSGFTLHEAMQQIEQFFAEPEAVATPTSAPPAPAEESASSASAPEQSIAAQPSKPGTSEPTEDLIDLGGDASPQPAAPAVTGPSTDGAQDHAGPGRAVQIFAAPSSATPAAALTQDPDAAYEPTIAHAQLHQQRLQANSHNKRLPSDKEIAERAVAEAAKIAAVREVSIKVRFPDNTSAQWTFGPGDDAAAVYAEVRSVMEDPSQPFKLVSPASKRGDFQDARGPGHNLVRDHRLEGRVVATVVWADSVPQAVRKAPFLRGEAARRAQQIPVPVVPAEVPDEEVKNAASASKPTKGEGGSSSGVKMPKWLKLPGKK